MKQPIEMKPIDHVRAIVYKMRVGALTYDEAKAEAQPYIDAMNKRMKELAKENKVSFKRVTFAGIAR